MEVEEGGGGGGEETEYLCAEQKGVQSIIFRQADRAVWGVYFYLDMEECGSATAAWSHLFNGGSRTAAVPP